MSTYTELSDSDLSEISRKHTYYVSRDQAFIPDVYERFDENEPCRARSAGPRLETGVFATTRNNPEPRQYESRNMRQQAETFKLKRLPWLVEERTQWPKTRQMNSRLSGRKTTGDQTDKTTLTRKDKPLRSSQAISDYKQSSFENWKVAGDRLFGRPSKSRQ